MTFTAARRPTGIAIAPVAVSCVSDTKVVGSAVPAKYIVAPVAKPVPLTVIVVLPGFTVFGLTDVTAGSGFCRPTVTLPATTGSA